jgi:hypothetical protein
METVLLNRKCQPDFHHTGIFFPYPGTELYDFCIRKGFIKASINTTKERIQAVIDSSPDFTKKQIQSAHFWFNYRVYKGYRPLWHILIKMMMVKIHSNSTMNLLFRKIVQLPIIRHVRLKLMNKLFNG